MTRSLPIKSFLAALTFAAFSLPSAHADFVEWLWDGNNADPNGAGNPTSIYSSFDSDTNRFTWSATFDDDTDGLTLVLSPGPNPKGTPDELAVLYMNREGQLAAYAYSGRNDSRSHIDPGTLIFGSNDTDLFNDVSVDTHTDRNGNITSRTFNIDIDASIINDFGATQNSGYNDWTGIAYGEEIGVWFHWWNNINTEFNSDGTVSDWWGEGDHAKQGWLDLTSQRTIPEPGSALLVTIAGATLLLRRRSRK